MNKFLTLKFQSLLVLKGCILYACCIFFTYQLHHTQGQNLIAGEDIEQIFKQAENYLQLNKYKEADSLINNYQSFCYHHVSQNLCMGKAISLKARIYYGLKKYPESDSLFRQSLNQLRMNLDNGYIDFGKTVVRYFFLLNRENKKDSARLLLLESKRYFVLQKDTLSKAYAAVIGMLGHVHSLLNEDSIALLYFQEWEQIISRVPEAEDAQIANRCGNFYLKKLNLQMAEQFYKTAIEITKKNGKIQSSDYATFCSNLAAVYLELKEYQSAEPFLKNAKNTYIYIQDTLSLNYFRLLNHFGIYCYGIGLYSESKQFYKKAIMGFEANPNPDWHHLASIHFDLAILYEQSDQLNEALIYFQRSKDIRENILKIKKEDYARTTAAIANTYQALGQKERALRTLHYAIPILQANLGEDNFIYAEFLKNLASMNLDYKQYEIADSLIRLSLEVYKRTQGEKSIDYASALELRALIHYDQAEYKEAIEYFNQANEIYIKKYKPDHLKISLLQIKLADCLRAQGQIPKALKLMEESDKNIKRLLGDQNVYSLDLIALEVKIYQSMGMFKKQRRSLLKLSAVQIDQILENSLYLSANELSLYIKQFKVNIDLLFHHTLKYFTQDEELIKSCLNASNFYKSFVLNKLLIERRQVYSSDQATDHIIKIKQLKEEYQLAAIQAEVKPDLLSQMRDEIHDEERYLTNVSDSIHKIYLTFSPKEYFAPRESLVDFIQYQTTLHPDSIGYAAIVYNHSKSTFTITPLFKAIELRKFFQQNIALRADYVERLYQPRQRGIGIEDESSASLYDIIWKPLEANLAGTEVLYFIPVGLLHRLNLTALYIQDEEIMADRFQMNHIYYAASRIDPSLQQKEIGSALIIGGIDFNSQTDSTSLFHSSVPHWKDLKWTFNEAKEIVEICGQSGIETQLLSKTEASENSFRNCIDQKPYDIIHIATHGFFFPQSDSSHTKVPMFQRNIKQLDDPMLRSGILLAGANHTWDTIGNLFPHQDGVLSAYELSALALDNTFLVVLSACETGLGDIDNAEGVYGLQRALKIAGVKYMIISLWQVPDKETSTFMVTFYRNLIYTNIEIEKAFHKTQQEMRERFVNPYQWAGFVLIK